MSPRTAASLRGSDQTLRDHLITVAAQLIDERGSSGLTVRDIANAAHVAGGALYNHFEDKEELLAHALATHVMTVMHSMHTLPKPGESSVDENLRAFVRTGLAVLSRVIPAFVGFFDHRGVIKQAMAINGGPSEAGGIPAQLSSYLRSEQQLGRISLDANPDSAAALIVGACHDLVLPRMLMDPDASTPIEVPDGFVEELVRTVMNGIGPRG
jgi:AcrR family transcriptional regulator